MKIKQLFHYISYCQYPFGVMALYYVVKPYLNGFEITDEKVTLIFSSINNMFIFIGLMIGFATLQDTNKTSLNFEKKIWENPKSGKRFILLIFSSMLLTLVFGLFGYFFATKEIIKELSIGSLVLGVGLIGFLKAAIEVFENHRSDKKGALKNIE